MRRREGPTSPARPLRPRRALAIGSLLLVMSACAGQDAAGPAAASATNDRPTEVDGAAIDGTALDGVEFDVRRDPG